MWFDKIETKKMSKFTPFIVMDIDYFIMFSNVCNIKPMQIVEINTTTTRNIFISSQLRSRLVLNLRHTFDAEN